MTVFLNLGPGCPPTLHMSPLSDTHFHLLDLEFLLMSSWVKSGVFDYRDTQAGRPGPGLRNTDLGYVKEKGQDDKNMQQYILIKQSVKL